MTTKSFMLPLDERLPAQPGAQFFSADGRHFLVSARNADDRVWAKYTLTIYDRASRARVGEFRSHVSQVPFFVADARVVFVTPPFSRLEPSGQLVEQPLKIRAVDLGTGQEFWSHEVRDTKYRGPIPP